MSLRSICDFKEGDRRCGNDGTITVKVYGGTEDLGGMDACENHVGQVASKLWALRSAMIDKWNKEHVASSKLVVLNTLVTLEPNRLADHG